MNSTTSAAILISRVILGVVLIAHGWQKFSEWGISGTADSFAAMGVPAASVAAVVAAVIELVGGILLIAGLFTRIVGALVVLNMIGAGIFASHFTSGILVSDGGWELVGVIAAAALLLVGVGAGAFSLDRVFLAKKS